MRPGSVLETVLYARDLDAAAAFYRDVIGLGLVSDMRPLSVCLRVGAGAVVLIFNPDESAHAGRAVPSHGVEGAGHVAFVIEADAYDAWVARLRAAGVVIEQEVVWEERWRDGAGRVHRSIYVRDPADNSVELITGDIWPGATVAGE